MGVLVRILGLGVVTACVTHAMPEESSPEAAVPSEPSTPSKDAGFDTGFDVEPDVAAPSFGKHNVVVATGSLTKGSLANFVRLGTYELSDDGNVTGSWWRWNQSSARDVRSGTGVIASNCGARKCDVLTASRFKSLDERETLQGKWQFKPPELRIEWTGGLTETWTATSSPDGKVVRLDNPRATGFSLTGGFGYASNAPLTSKTSISELRSNPAYQKRYQQDYFTWTAAGVTEGHGGFYNDARMPWKECTGGMCMAALQPPGTPNCSCGANGAPVASNRMHYVADLGVQDRRNTYWIWCQCLADLRDEHCYTGNSHVIELLQILDDDSTFLGWVAVEASFNANGTSASGDMLSLLRYRAF